MAQFPALPLFTDAYLGDTTHLSTIEHGAYLLLLMAMWRAGGSLPADDQMIARYTKLRGSQWRKMKPVIMGFFELHKGQITQRRLSDELDFARRRSITQAHKAKARWLKDKDTSGAAADLEDMPRQSCGNASLSLPLSSSRRSSPSVRARERAPAREDDAPKIVVTDMPDDDVKLYEGVMNAVDVGKDGRLPTYWQAPGAIMHVIGWRALGLSDDEIVTIAKHSQKNHPEPPNGPMALDRIMQISAAYKTRPLTQNQKTGGQGYDGRSSREDRMRNIINAAAEGST